MEKFDLKKLGYILALILFTVITGWLIFGYLGYPQIEQSDEAAHGINAYEMLQQGSILVNYLKHEVDYFNSKPPLMLWFIMLSFKAFGPTPFALRLPSAIFGFILYILVIWWTNKKFGRFQSLFWAAGLPTLEHMFHFHMFRSGDMDALYTLFFMLAIIGLLYALTEPLKGAVMYGLFGGLCFMTKGQHMYTLVLVGILFIPFLKKVGVKLIHYLLALAAGLVVILPWAVARFMFDGTKFFHALFITETNLKISMANSVGVMAGFFLNPAVIISVAVCVVAFVVACITKKSFKESLKDGILTPNRYVLVTWALVVLLCNFLIGIELEWYIYSAYIPVLILGGDALAYLVRKASGKKPVLVMCISLSVACLVFFAGMAVKYGVSYFNYDRLMGGSPIMGFYYDNVEMVGKYSMEYSKCPAYIELSKEHVLYKSSPGDWEIDRVFAAETTNDVLCFDGGVDAFLATDNMDAILYLDKGLWDQYNDVLSGHVILMDSEMFVFSKHFYGE